MMMKKTIFTAISAVALLAGGTLAVATFGGTERYRASSIR